MQPRRVCGREPRGSIHRYGRSSSRSRGVRPCACFATKLGRTTSSSTCSGSSKQCRWSAGSGDSVARTVVRAGEVPGVVRVGRSIRIGRDALLRWMEGNGSPALGDDR